MRNTKIVRLLLTFSRTDLKRFHAFLESPYFNQKEDCTRFFLLLQEKILNKSVRGHLAESEAWEILFPGRPVSIPVFRMLRTAVQKLAYDFLAFEGFSKTPAEQKAALLRQLNMRQLDQQFERELLESENWFEQNLIIDPDHSVSHFLLQRESFSYKINRFPRETADAVAIFGLLSSLDELSSIHRLKFLCSYLANRSKAARKPQSDRQLPPGFSDPDQWEGWIDNQVRELLEAIPIQNNPIASIFRSALNLQLNTGDESAFSKLKGELMQLPPGFSPVDAYDLFTHARNFCVIRINSGDDSFLRAYHELNREMLSRGLLEEELKIIPDLFITIVEVDSIIGEFEYLEEFIQKYKHYLPGNTGEITTRYCRAVISFYQGEFAKAESLLLRVAEDDFDGFVSGVKARIYLLQVYYEQEKFDEMEKLLNSFGMYLRRNKLLTGVSKKNYVKRINAMRKLMNLNLFPGDKSRATQFLEELHHETAPAAHKRWLISKVKDIK